MKSLAVFFKDMGATLRRPKVFIPILVVLFIPVLYSGLFLTAFWDPYGKMNELPVAVVNEDRGAAYEDKELKVGADLVEELRKSDDFAWNFVTREQAEQGMKNNDYYMTIVIPDNFSAQATTLMDENPAPAQLIFEPNEGYNFLAAQIGGTAVKEIKTKVSAKVTEAYTETLFDQVENISGGLSDAGDGASALNEGAVKLDDGADQLKANLAKLVDGTTKLQNGVTPLAQGSESLYGGINEVRGGAATLAGGLSQLDAASQQLRSGAQDAQQGSQQLQAGLQASLEGAKKLQAGLEASEQGSSSLKTGLASSVQGSAKVVEGANAVAQGLEQLAQANPELASNASVQQLLAASKAVAQGADALHQGNQQLLQGSDSLHRAQQQLVQGGGELAAAQEQLLQGATALEAGQAKLSGGLEQFGSKLSEAAAGGQKLASGTGQLSAGAEQLLGGVKQLSSGVGTLTDGSKQLNVGAGELKDGMDQLTEGTGELAGKLTDAAEQTSSVQKTDALVSMYAEPVSIDEHKLNEVPNYGTGFAPYFLSLGLFVGALISTLVVPVRGSSVAEASGWNRFVSRTLAFTGMSLFQSLLAVIMVLYGLGLEVQSVPLFYLFSFVTSLSYMFIIQALVTWLENPGRFLAILILIFQLTTSAGTFPLELIPNWMKVFNPLLPMTYSVKGYKAVVSTGETIVIWDNIGILLGFGVVFLALTLVYFIRHESSRDVSPEASLSVQAH